MMTRCWKVKVKTTNAFNDNSYGANESYIDCIDGYIYVLCKLPSQIETIVRPDVIISIEQLGLGYIANTYEEQ